MANPAILPAPFSESVEPKTTSTKINVTTASAMNALSLIHISTRIASHVGGYDEWKADITEAVEAFRRTPLCRER